MRHINECITYTVEVARFFYGTTESKTVRNNYQSSIIIYSRVMEVTKDSTFTENEIPEMPQKQL